MHRRRFLALTALLLQSALPASVFALNKKVGPLAYMHLSLTEMCFGDKTIGKWLARWSSDSGDCVPSGQSKDRYGLRIRCAVYPHRLMTAKVHIPIARGQNSVQIHLNVDGRLIQKTSLSFHTQNDLTIECRNNHDCYLLKGGGSWGRDTDGGYFFDHDKAMDFTNKYQDFVNGAHASVRVSSQPEGYTEIVRFSLNGFTQASRVAEEKAFAANKIKECDEKPCFMTTAACGAVGLPDDCFELTQMRRFRDRWLSKQPGGKEQVALYYALAPRISPYLSRMKLLNLYWGAILPCAIMAKLGMNRLAYARYRSMINGLKDKYVMVPKGAN